MTNDRNHIDGRIRDAIRAGAQHPDASRLDALAVRIETAVKPELNGRRWKPRSTHWWEVAGGWANMLIPAGLTVILASAALLWAARPAAPAPANQSTSVVTLGAVRAPRTQPAIVEFAVDQIVGTPTESRPPRSDR